MAQRVTSGRNRLRGSLVLGAGMLAALAGRADADMFYWCAKGATNRFQETVRTPVDPITLQPFAASTTPYAGAVTGTERSYLNLMRPNVPGGTTGVYAPEFSIYSAGNDLIFANTFHADRTADFEDYSLDLRSLQFTTRGDATIRGAGVLSLSDCLLRWPDATGTLTLEEAVETSRLWLGGSGEVVMWALFSTPGTPIIKSGPGRLVLDPRGVYSPFTDPLVVYSGDVVLRGTGERAMFYQDGMMIGREFGGEAGIPTTVSYPGWESVPASIPNPAPVVHVQRSRIISETGVAQTRFGAEGTLVLDPSEAISFEGNLVSNSPGDGLVVCAAPPSTVVDLGPAHGFSGTYRLDSGTLRTSPTNGGAQIVFNSMTAPADATLDVVVPTSTTGFHTPYSGHGHFAKSGAGRLELNVPVNATFTGTYAINEGVLATSMVAGQTVLRNSVDVNGGNLQSLASENIDDATEVAVGVRWFLSGATETIGNLVMNASGTVPLGGGTLRLNGDLSVNPFGNSTATITRPGTLFFTGTTAKTIDIAGTGPTPLLDISATVAGAPIAVTGTGMVQFSGAFTSPSLTVRSGTARLNMPTGAVRPGAITVGFVDPLNPSAPAARLELAAPDQIPDTMMLQMVNRAEVDLRGLPEQIGGLNVTGAGPFSIVTSNGVDVGELALGGNATFSGGATTFNGALNLLTQTRTFQVNTGASLTLGGTLYSGVLSKSGTGSLRLDGLESFIPVQLLGLGNSAGTATVAGLTGTASLRIDTTLTVNPGVSASYGYGGVLFGAGSLTKTGSGQMELNGGAVNSYSGATRVEGGTLFLNRFPGTTVIPGNMTVASGGTVRFAGGASNQIADAADIVVEAGGAVNMAGQSETVRNITLSGAWNVDAPNGTAGSLAATQSILVAGGTLDGTLAGGGLTLFSGSAHVRGAVSTASIGIAGGTLSVGGFAGNDQLTINGTFGFSNSNAVLEFTTGQATDPALIRALGGLTYPFAGAAVVKVNQSTPQPVGSSIKLIDFGTGTSVPQLSRYALAAPASGSGRGVLTLSNRVLSYVVTQNPCAPDINGSGDLTVQDLFDYLTVYFSNGPGADFNNSGGVSVQDLFEFLAAWFQGC